MPNTFNSQGLTIATQTELVTNLTTQYQAAYGPNIVVTSDSPDGQTIYNYAQSTLDTLDLTSQVNASFSLTQATGVILDQRAANLGIFRQAGSYTITPITVVMNTSVNLYGLDQSVNPVFTVSDTNGNQWQLITTQLGVTGTQVFSFQAANPGAISTIPNTITTIVTVVLGVVSVNNPTTYTTLGVNEEDDAQFMIRALRSTANGGQGWLRSLIGNLSNVTGVTYANVYENDTNATNSDGTPAHCIWAIVGGSAAASAIANTIYAGRNAGCSMRGANTYSISQLNSTPITIRWDGITSQNIFISFTATSINGTTAPAISTIIAALPTSFVPTIYQEININALATTVQTIDPNTLVTNAGFSTAQTQILTLSGTPASGAFEINYGGTNTSSIPYSDSASTIQGLLRTLTTDSGLTVTGTPVGGTITITFASTFNVNYLFYVTNNTLETSGSAAITFTYNEGYSNTLTPQAKNYQFIVSSTNIIITPIIIIPNSPTVAINTTTDFAAQGGYGVYVWAFVTNNSGGSINSSTGVYVAGSTPSTDTISVTDSLGNVTTTAITVI